VINKDVHNMEKPLVLPWCFEWRYILLSVISRYRVA